MRVVRKTFGVTLSVGLLFGLALACSGCDSGGQKAEYKPIESNILKKLGNANQAQSESARGKLPPSAKKKG